MKNQIRDNLIATIKEKIPSGVNLTNYLSDTLNIGRESAYRRIRGDINFTFEEVVTLSQNLKFSVDNIIGVNRNENALFNIHMLQNLDYIDIYVNKIQEYGRLFRETSMQYETRARISINTLPYYFHIGYELLSKLRIYKWLYQNQKISPNVKFADLVLPTKVMEAHRTFYQDIQKVHHVTIIMDHDVFWSVARDIEYFFKRGLITDQDMQLLKKELHTLIDEMEQIATHGTTKGGSKVEMYVSAVVLEASYLHFEYGDNQFAQVRIYSISAIDSYDKGLCQIQKDWMESQKKYSVLVSESGEMQRFEYMNKQREYIEQIVSP